MKYIKDFFYNISDFFIIILILGLAGGIIYWRVNIIMDYPEVLAAEARENAEIIAPSNSPGNSGAGEHANSNASSGANDDKDEEKDADTAADANAGNNAEGTADTENDSDSDSAVDTNTDSDSNGEDGNENENGDDGDTDNNDNNSTTTDGPRDNTIWKDGRLKVDMTVDLASGDSYDAVESLVNAGLFSTYYEFETICAKIDANPSMIKAGTFSFPAGYSQEDIARDVTYEE